MYFNLCDGSSDEDYPGLDVVQALEEFNLPFTGADSKFYDPTREEMQAVAEAHGVGFARGYRVSAAKRTWIDWLATLQFPLMVKHPQSYSSIGMTRESRVENPEQLHTQFKRIASEFGSARVEEFIVGREFNVFVVDNPGDLGSSVCVSADGADLSRGGRVLAYRHQVGLFGAIRVQRGEDPALDDEAAGSRAQDVPGDRRNRLRPMRCADEDDGSLFVLEINANPGILYPPGRIWPGRLHDPV